MSKKLIIVGCSWGCGEWQGDNNDGLIVAHPGLEEYLSKDYKVVNLSRGNSSNWKSCYTLRNYLSYVKNFSECEIIVIQTDAWRSDGSHWYQINYDQLYQTSSSLENFYRIALQKFYSQLDAVGRNHNLKIHLVGGLSGIDIDAVAFYNNLVVLSESWIKLIDKTQISSIIPLLLAPGLLVDAKRHNRLDLVEQIIQHSDQSFLQAQSLMETHYFGPMLGDFHPSRYGHELLAKYIKEFLNKESK